MTNRPPEYPRATSSPTLILLASGLAGSVGLLIGLVVGMGMDLVERPAAPARAAPTVTVTATAPPAAAPSETAPPVGTAPPASAGPSSSTAPPGASRTLVVGRDIQPGTYRTTGPAPGQPVCYWARLNAVTPTPTAIIAADMPKGPASVTILPTDKAFQTGGCADWLPG